MEQLESQHIELNRLRWNLKATYPTEIFQKSFDENSKNTLDLAHKIHNLG